MRVRATSPCYSALPSARWIDSSTAYEIVQLSRHTDRIPPNGVCLLPPLKRCKRGNACLTCDHFATDARHLPELQIQLAETEALIERRRAVQYERHSLLMFS